MVRLREPEEEGTEQKERLVREAWKKSEVDRSNWINLRSPWMNLQRVSLQRREKKKKGFWRLFSFSFSFLSPKFEKQGSGSGGWR